MQTATTKPAPAAAPLAPVFRTAAGRLTNYALACGCVETFENEGRAVTLWHEGGQVFHVRAHDHNKGQRLEWETFERLTDARRHFDKWRTTWRVTAANKDGARSAARVAATLAGLHVGECYTVEEV